MAVPLLVTLINFGNTFGMMIGSTAIDEFSNMSTSRFLSGLLAVSVASWLPDTEPGCSGLVECLDIVQSSFTVIGFAEEKANFKKAICSINNV